MSHVIPVLVSARSRIVVAVDWTEFASNGHSTVAVSMITEHGRATPLMWMTLATKKLKKRRAQFEDRVLWRLRLALPDHVHVTVLADRGFADTGLFWTLQEKMRFDYVIRFKAGTFVESADGDARPASEWVPTNGQAKHLLQARMTRQRRAVPGVVCVKRAGMKEAWCLVTSLADASAEDVIQLYARRFDIEHMFRDQKDWRFGLALDHMTLGTPGRRDRMLLVLALATMFSVIVGAAGEQLGLDRTLRANTDARKRTHSFRRLRAHLPERMGKLHLQGLNERLRFYRYRSGQRFTPHMDHWYRPNERQITLHTALVYFNDGFEGGETRFQEQLEAVVVPRAGSAAIFQHKLRHEGCPVRRGTKYALRTDVIYEAPEPIGQVGASFP